MLQTLPRLGISTASYFNRLPIEDAVTDLAAHGVQLAELFLNTFSEYDAAFAALLKARADAGGVSVYSVHPMSMQFEPQLFSPHPRQRADALRLFEQVLDSGRLLCATHYVMHGAAHLMGAAKGLGLARVAPILRDLADTARGHGMVLTLENVSWCLFSTPDFGRRLVDGLGDALRYTIDIKQAVRSGYDPLDYVDAVGALTENLHLCDFVRTETGPRWVLPGRGECDFSVILAALFAKGYAGPAFIEVYSDAYAATGELYDCCRTLAGRFKAADERAHPVVVR